MEGASFYGILPDSHPDNPMGMDVVLFQTPIYRIVGLAENGSYHHLKFTYRKELLPQSIHAEIVEYFRRDTAKEAICRVVYDVAEKQYTVDYPVQSEGNKLSVEYRFSLLPPTKKVVVTIHSHNTMPAYFSSVDDRDEGAGFGIYGVIGRLDEEAPQECYRVCLDGNFVPVLPRQLWKEDCI